MFYSTLLIATAALSGLVSAQNYSTSGPISVVPSSVNYDTRLAWCRSQTATCPQICGGQASPNQCSADDLSYQCVCTDGSHPNISSYQQTIPFFECQQWKADCVKAHPNDLSGQTACLSVTCGNRKASTGGSSASGAASSSSTASPTSGGSSNSGSNSGSSGASSSAAASATNTGGAVALSVARDYGTGIIAGGMLALFGLAL